MIAGGIPIAGRLVPVPGVTVIPPASMGGPAWAKLSPGDYRMRPRLWIRQAIAHTTGGRWPMPIVPGAGPGGEAARIADIWYSDPVHSGAHGVVDSAGVAVFFADLAHVMAYHAEGSNPWSFGIEMAQARDSSVRQATIDTTARVLQVACAELGIPFQFHAGAYHGEPLSRMETGAGEHRHNSGGPDCVGIFGHRDNTGERGRGDPGDALAPALEALGAEGLDYRRGQDLEVGRARQRWLVAHGERLVIDGLIGPASLAAARRQGFARWRDVPAG